jgi:hypothetical protein
MLGLCGRGWLALPVVATMAAVMGCERKPAAPAPVPSASVPEVTLSTPEDAARSVLTCLQAHLQAVARDDQQAAKACLEKLRTVAAVTAIEQEFARWPRYKTVIGEDLIEGYVSNWAAAIAYYAGITAKDNEGFHFDQMRRSSEAPSKVAVVVPASGPNDDALIQVTCVREDGAVWRVARIEFVTELPTALPRSQPTSQPS